MGYTPDGRYIIVVCEVIDEGTIRVATAYDVPRTVLIETAMSRKIERVFRDCPMTPDEVANDERIRNAVQAEFPPATASTDSSSISDSLRNAIRQSSQSADEIAEKARISSQVVARVLSGERDIHLETADRLANVLGVKLTPNSVPNV